MSTIGERLKAVIVDVTKVDSSSVTPDANVLDLCHYKPLVFFDLQTTIREEFGLKEVQKKVVEGTVQELQTFVEQNVPAE